MSKNKDEVLGHASDNDGIEEYDNALPDWWLGLFLFTIVWAIGYGVDYHFVSGRSQTAYYEAEIAAAKVRWPDSGPKPLAFDDETLKAGAKVFGEQCAACHGAALGGGIGPNLLDAGWIHGSEPEQIRATITNGVAAKGMPAWGPVLGPDKVGKVAAFVIDSFRKTGLTPVAVASGAATPAPVAAEVMTGEGIYTQNCVACHGPELKGVVGPSLVDATWIHGGTLAEIEHTITNGVPEKGMVAWGPVLGAEKISLVARFVHEKNEAAVRGQ
jgi:cytochrome c oxidase cbb3-type subunit III